MILLLVAASNYFGAVFSRLGSANMIAEALLNLPLPPMIMLIIILAVISIDQITKELVRRLLPLSSDPVQVIPGLLDLTHVQNTGAAFGLLNGVDFPYKPFVMIATRSARF